MESSVRGLFGILSIFLLLNFVGGTSVFKQLAGPPSEFSLHRIPSSIPQAINSAAARFNINLQTSALSASVVDWQTTLPVDSADGFAFALFCPVSLDVVLLDPENKAVPNLSQYATQSSYVIGDDSYYSVPVTNYFFPNFPTGIYTLQVQSNSALSAAEISKLSVTPLNGIVFLSTPTTVESLAYISSYDLLQGTQVGIVAQLYDSALYGAFNGTLPIPIPAVEKGLMNVELPDGEDIEIQLRDDGIWPDLFSGDGIFGGAFEASEVGNYVVTTILTGTDPSGLAFTRTTDHLIPIITQTVSLTGEASAVLDTVEQTLQVSLQVKSTQASQTLRAYSEVFGTAQGSFVPVAWIGGLVNITTDSTGNSFVTLSLDLDWLSLAGAEAPFLLQNIYISDINTNIPLSQVSQINVAAADPVVERLSTLLRTREQPTEITERMRNGKLPEKFAQKVSAAQQQTVFVHGYCSKQNPWQKSGDFPANAAYFLNPGASLSNEDFAQKILEFTNSYDAFALIGHSQGGMANLHLLNYYFSGAQASTAPQTLQTVGTPYNGNSGAGSAADLIGIFGVGCGANPSLTKDGAALWLSGITSESRKKAYFYTTQYPPGLFKYCQAGVGLVLSQPNDGTAELKLSKLSGGNDMGHTEGQCHTENMQFLAQYYDKARNAVILKNATPSS